MINIINLQEFREKRLGDEIARLVWFLLAVQPRRAFQRVG